MRVPLRPLFRDLMIWAVAAAAWSLLLNTAQPSVLLEVLAGLLAVVSAATLHEWGHLIGALATKSVVRFPNRVLTPLLFDFDTSENNRRQFIWLGIGGYLGSVAGVLLLAALLPRDRLASYVAWIGVALGTIATFAIEVPATVRVMRGAELPAALLTVADPKS